MNRNEINSAATVEDITNSFFRHFAEGGLAQVSIGDICEDCHISRTTFYRYFTDKYDVLGKKEQQLLDGTARFVHAFSDPAFSDAAPDADGPMISLLNYVFENMTYYRIILASELSRRFMVRWSSQINDALRERMGRTKYRGNELKLRIISGGVLAGLSYWIEKEPSLSPEIVAGAVLAELQEKL